jgi:two-component system KDP operon response regulator KdpE
MTRVLVVDDEPQLRRALDVNLVARGYDVETVGTGRDALRQAAANPPDVVLLDLGLPDIDGLAVVQGLRGWSNAPIVVLSARDAESEKVAALDAGADDYVTKPFGINELLARLRAALRRHQSVADVAVVRTADFTVDLDAVRAWKHGEEVHLTPTEWGLVGQFVRNPGRLLTQQWLLQHVWGPQYGSESGYLRVYLAALRRKLEPNPSQPRYFLTEPGMGYRFEPGEEQPAPA